VEVPVCDYNWVVLICLVEKKVMETTEINFSAPETHPHWPSVPWGWRDMLLAILVAGLALLGLSLLAAFADRTLHLQLRQNSDLIIILVTVQDVIVVGIAWLFSVVRYRVGWDRLGFRSFSTAIGCSMSVGLLFASYAFRFLYVIIAKLLGVQLEQQQILSYLDLRGVGFLLTLVGVAVVAPIAEEIVFRGFLYGGLRQRIGVIGAMLVSASFFTALHMSLDLFIPIFVLGIFLAWLYEYTGSLYPGILLHAANNAISVVLLFLLQASGLFPVSPAQVFQWLYR
jgi:uncharacterized protein